MNKKSFRPAVLCMTVITILSIVKDFGLSLTAEAYDREDIASYYASLVGTSAKDWGGYNSSTQCVELPKYAVEQYFGVYTKTLGLGDGKSLYHGIASLAPDIFEEIDYYDGFQVVPGDIISYESSTSPANGHAALVLEVYSPTEYLIAEQWAGSGTVRSTPVTVKGGQYGVSYSIVGVARPYAEDPCHCSAEYAGQYIVTTEEDDLNMRNTHSTSGSIITTIPSGSEVTVTKANGTWAHVTFAGQTGYCSMQYLSKIADECRCNEDYAGTYIVNTAEDDLNMRDMHSTSGSVITTIPKGSEVTVTKANGTWAHVTFAGQIGYCSMQYLKKKETPQPEPEIRGTPMSVGAGQTIPDGDYYIFSALSPTLYLDIEGSEVPAASKTNVYVYNCSTSKQPPECDLWTVKYLNNGFYSICQKNTSIALEVEHGDTIRGVNARVYSSNSSDAQLWSINQTDDGFTLQSKCNSYYLDVSGSKKTDTSNVLLWEQTQNPNQRWNLVSPTPKPAKSVLTADRTVAFAGEKIHFTAESDSATNYTLCISKGEKQLLSEDMPNGKLILALDEPGTYSAYVSSYNQKGELDSKLLTITIKPYEIVLYESEQYVIPLAQTGCSFKTSNSQTVVVSKSGVITAMGKGLGIVTVTDSDGKQTQILVSVLHEPILGDCNSDGAFDENDLEAFLDWLLTAKNDIIRPENADFNHDGHLNSIDMTMMKCALL